MNEAECINKMVAPGTYRPGKYRGGVIQVWVTRACDKACFHCTQGSQLSGKPEFITLEQVEVALKSLRGYWGVVGMFGGNPATHPQFEMLCHFWKKYVPYEQRGIWCNNPMTVEKAAIMRGTFNPAVSNLNVHLDQQAYDLFKAGWPECGPVGLTTDSRHSPPFVAMRDVLRKGCECAMDDTCSRCNNTRLVYDEGRAWELISNCDINQHWSAMVGVFRGEVRAWFCEVAGAQAMLHQHEPDYPDTGYDIERTISFRAGNPENRLQWWQLGMDSFSNQVRKHCHECGVPLRGHGELAQADAPNAKEQTSATHAAVYQPKRKGRSVEVVTDLVQLGSPLVSVVKYLQNSKV